jgi:hypothetical protein
MSFDPYAPLPEQQPTQPPPGSAPGYNPMQSRVYIPAILLIVLGIINLVYAFVRVGQGAYSATLSTEQIRKTQIEQQKQLKEAGLGGVAQVITQQDPQTAKIAEMAAGFGLGFLGLLGALASILGGIRMYQLRSYGLAITGAITAALPLVSCSGCCCFGEIIGIWAIVVLLNPEVRAAFQ